MTLDEKKQTARAWFRTLRDEICASFEAIESELTGTCADRTPGRFTIMPWDKADQQEVSAGSGLQKGGGEIGMMKGRVFEKVGVNISVVEGEFDAKFCNEIPGATDDPRFWAAGISLVAHMQSPLVPAAHFNTRMIVVGSCHPEGRRPEGSHATGKDSSVGTMSLPQDDTPYRLWFGGGGDLNPMVPIEQDTADFHQAFQDACDRYDPAFHPAFKDWCDEYFYIPHRQMARGVGGIFYDYLGLNSLGSQTGGDGDAIDLTKFGKGGVDKEKTQAGMELAANAALDWDQAFAYTQDVGRAFRDIYPALIRRHMNAPWTAEQREWQLQKRGYYAEYNLLYDRGTRFGLMTGGNTEAILMSLPPVATWG